MTLTCKISSNQKALMSEAMKEHIFPIIYTKWCNVFSYKPCRNFRFNCSKVDI